MPKAALPCFSIHDDPKMIRDQLLGENPRLASILAEARTIKDVRFGLRAWVDEELAHSPEARTFYKSPTIRRLLYEALQWQEIAAIRILDYIDNSGRTFVDPNLRGQEVVTRPFGVLFDSTLGRGEEAGAAFWMDMLNLFRQFTGAMEQALPEHDLVAHWMERHPSGLNKDVVELRRRNRERIFKVLTRWIEEGRIPSKRYTFDKGSARDKRRQLLEWWKDHRFHLKFASRDPDQVNEMLGHSLSEETLAVLRAAQEKGIPIFVNPYYLSLLNVDSPEELEGADLAIRDYVFYSRQLVEEFGHIVAWEKEDVVEPGQPNEAGWLLPSHHNVHRRYPDVAILIPETMGRACGGLCSSCQRMYDFQRGNLNFDLERLAPKEAWPDKLERLLRYWEEDTQLRDILITGGDALMSSDRALERILDSVANMARRKREANRERRDGEKFAELQRVRLGTRLPVYLPQRITTNLLRILAAFKTKASALGVRQFVIQTHFETAMEVTPAVRDAVRKLLAAGWVVTNQQVFITAASRRGHTARLRQVLNDIGVLPYYTFTVKGFRENQHNFAPSSRVVQEQVEEKYIGLIPYVLMHRVRDLPNRPQSLVRAVKKLRREAGVPFLPTDRNVLNMPGVGKSLTFRCIGITTDGRRILQFDHDPTRRHSPILEQMGKVEIIESKSVGKYLDQISEMNDDPREFTSLWGYSVGATEPLMPLYEYPGYYFRVTRRFSNLRLPAADTEAATKSA